MRMQKQTIEFLDVSFYLLETVIRKLVGFIYQVSEHRIINIFMFLFFLTSDGLSKPVGGLLAKYCVVCRNNKKSMTRIDIDVFFLRQLFTMASVFYCLSATTSYLHLQMFLCSISDTRITRLLKCQQLLSFYTLFTRVKWEWG